MAKTKINQSKRCEIRSLISDYIRTTFNNDEEYEKLLKKKEEFELLAQNEYNRLFKITDEITEFLQKSHSYGSMEVYNYYGAYNRLSIDIVGAYSYNFNYNSEDLKDDAPYLDSYFSDRSGSRIIQDYLKSLDEFNSWIEDLNTLNDKYSTLQAKMNRIVDNCKFLDDVKEYIPINSVIKYVDETIYNCSTFVSVVTNEDLDMVKNFINSTKK